jgi:hypothetical protein
MQPTGVKKRGCFFYGCLTLGVCVVVGVVGGYFAVRYAMRATERLALDYTDLQPAAIPQTRLTADQLLGLRERVGVFQSALREASYPAELVLTSDELNAWLAERSGGSTNAGSVVVAIRGDQIEGNVSIPLSDIGPFKLKGRHLNGFATLAVGLTNQVLEIRIRQLAVKGTPLPTLLLAELQKRNLAQEIQKDPKTAEWIAKFDSIEVREGKLILRSRVKR